MTLTCGAEIFVFDDDEHCALAELNTLYGNDGGNIGRLLLTQATLSPREVVAVAVFVNHVRTKLRERLVVYDHGRGTGTVCFQRRPWYELVKRCGVRYEKPTPRYVKGEKGKLASIDKVIYARGRVVKDSAAKAQTLADVAPLVSAMDKLESVVALGAAGATFEATPRKAYEYF